VRRGLRIFGPAVLVLAAFAALLVGLAVGAGASAPLHQDPGAGVRWGLPIAKLLVDLGAAGMLGSLALAAFALREPADAPAPREPAVPAPAGATPAAAASPAAAAAPTPPRPRTERDAAMDVAAASAALLTVAAAVTAFLSYADSTGQRISGAKAFGDGLGSFLTSVSLGRTWVAVIVMAALATAFCFGVRGRGATIALTLFGAGTLVPLALQGDLTGTPGQGLAISSLGLHLVFAAIWLGALLALVLIRRTIGEDRLPVVLARYASLALVCLVAVGVSGLALAGIRLHSAAGLATPYGALVVAKAVALAVLGIGAVLYRRVLLGRMRGPAPAAPRATASRRTLFAAFALIELAVLGAASGLATALSRTTSPAETHAATASPGTTPADLLTGSPLPAPADLARLAGSIRLDPLWLLVVGFGAFFYLVGVRRVRRAGRPWPLARTFSWMLGLLLLLYVTNGGLAAYRATLFSAHLAVFASVAFLVPVLLALALPVTLAVHGIRPRSDGSGGPREWIIALVGARATAPLARPWITGALLIASFWVWLTTRALNWSVTDPVGYHVCLAWMLVAGYLFAQSVIARDPLPYRAAYPVRLIVLVAVAVAHIVLGVVVAVRQGLWMPEWFAAMGRTWGLGAIADQQLGGRIAFGLGLVAVVVLGVAVARQWAGAARPGAARPGTAPGGAAKPAAARPGSARIRSTGDGDGE